MTNLQARYSQLIEEIVQRGLQGKGQTREQVYELIATELEPATEEIFNICLTQQIGQTETQINQADSLSQARASRALRTLQTIQLEWQRYQQEVNAKDHVANALFRISNAEPDERLAILVDILRPDHEQAMAMPMLEQLASGLAIAPQREEVGLSDYASGIQQGLKSWKAIERHLVSWIYAPTSSVESGGRKKSKSPWQLWSMQAIGDLPRELFKVLHSQQSVEKWAASCQHLSIRNWLELVLVLQRAQHGLIRWANQQPYEADAAQKLLSSLYLGFASTWVQLGQGLDRAITLSSNKRRQMSHISRNIGLQFLRQYTQHPQFPLYGNANHTPQNKSLCDALRYLSQPLNQTDAAQEKARILTVVGCLVLLSGKCEEAHKLHQQSLELSQAQQDTACSIANLNHLSRIATMQSQCSVAINQAQRALILARQVGDAQGEANALMNLGTASSQQAQLMEAPVKGYEAAMEYLTEAIEKAKDLGDQHCEGLCANALANICITLNHPGEALRWLQTGFKATNTSGDLYLQAKHFTSMAEACKQVSHPGDAIYAACLGLYYFDRIEWRDWRRPAALLTQLKERLGQRFDQLLAKELAPIVQQIGSDGFTQITRRLEEYGQTMGC